MRIRLFLALTSVSLVATGLGIEACGGTTSDTSTTADSSTEASVDAAKEAAVDAADAAPQCDPKGDPLKGIPDASLADGASTTGVCIGCLESKCKAEIAKCAADCPCQNIAGDALTCYTKNAQNPAVCLGSFAGVPKATQTIGLALIGCVNSSCGVECAVSAFNPDAGDGGDGG
jgi:hypothetical protein